jgi:hypothetical protein
VNVNPSLRGFAILVVVAAIITAFQLEIGLEVVLVFLQILFLLAIAYVLFLLWRNRRDEIAMWSRRSQVVFYGGAALALADIGVAFTSWFPKGGLESLVFLIALAAGAFAMWRVWRDEHTYGY